MGETVRSILRAEAEAQGLVLIDPEDREQVHRLYDAYVSASGVSEFPRNRAAMQAALREFAAPSTPPRSGPPAPVVTDAEARAMRTALARLDRMDPLGRRGR